jgi:hypothetical protein
MVRRLAFVLVLLASALLARAALVRAGEPTLPAPVARLFETGRWDATPKGLRIVALSHVADACAARADLACVQRARALAEQTRPPLAADLARDDHGLWLSHYALILADEIDVATRVAAEPRPHADAPRVDLRPARDELLRVARALAARSLAEKTAIVPSYPNNRARWPADQTATLAALGRADRALGTHLVDEPLARFRARYATVDADGRAVLPVSEATGAHATSKLPRGCALSWSVRYLAEVDRPLADALWAAYKRDSLVSVPVVGIAGFREWPRGVNRPADVDSGPIVQGIGAAASAFGIAAARALGDEDTATAIEGSAALAEGLGLGKGVSETVLAAAIRDVGTHAGGLPAVATPR